MYHQGRLSVPTPAGPLPLRARQSRVTWVTASAT